jgi:hypothetical protein
VLLKVQRRLGSPTLKPLVGKVAARQHIAVQMFDKLIANA